MIIYLMTEFNLSNKSNKKLKPNRFALKKEFIESKSNEDMLKGLRYPIEKYNVDEINKIWNKEHNPFKMIFSLIEGEPDKFIEYTDNLIEAMSSGEITVSDDDLKKLWIMINEYYSYSVFKKGYTQLDQTKLELLDNKRIKISEITNVELPPSEKIVLEYLNRVGYELTL